MDRQTCLPWLSTSALPSWSQRMTVLPDGVQPDQRFNECGETCVAMLAAGVWGARLSPDALRAALRGVSGSGLTDGLDLVSIAAYANIQMHLQTPHFDAAHTVLAESLADWRPVIMLGIWPTPGAALHWLLATDVSPQGVSYINPWGGVRSSIPWNVFDTCYAGALVVSNAHLHVDASSWPIPW